MAVTESQVAALELEKVIPKVRVLFERDDKFYAHIKKRDVEKIVTSSDASTIGIEARWIIPVL